MRHLSIVILAACSSGSPGETPPAIAVHAAPHAEVKRAPDLIVHAAPSAAISVIATTDDGGAAATGDQFGVRLWPTVDGMVEPVVVHAPVPKALALARDGQGFALAIVDDAGGGTLLQIAATGDVRGRAAIAPDPAISTIIAMSHGFVVLRADQTVVAYDFHGTALGTLASDPGTRIANLVTRGDAALALIERGKHVQGRWITLGKQPAWGETTAEFAVDAKTVVLSPDRASIAASTRDHHTVSVALATGVATANVCGDPPEQGQVEADPRIGAPIGFTQPHVLACDQQGTVAWFTNGLQLASDTEGRGQHVTAIGNQGLLEGIGTTIALRQPGRTRFLGYAYRDQNQTRISAAGVLMGRGDLRPLLLDVALHPVRVFDLQAQNGEVSDLAALDNRYLVVVRQNQREAQVLMEEGQMEANVDKKPTSPSVVELQVFDADTQMIHQRVAIDLQDSVTMQYVARDHMLAVTGTIGGIGGARLFAFDPTTGTLGPPTAIANVGLVGLVDPERAGGFAAVGVRTTQSGPIAVGVRAEDLAMNRQPLAVPLFSIEGNAAAIDRDGAVYALSGEDAIRYRLGPHGRTKVKFAGAGTKRPRPSDDAGSVAFVGGEVLDVYDASSGALRWQVPAAQLSDVGWMPGRITLVYSGALVELDPENGKPIVRTCGWAFQLADHMLPESNQTETVCDAE